MAKMWLILAIGNAKLSFLRGLHREEKTIRDWRNGAKIAGNDK
jgi:hypothetical protein